MSTNWKEVSLGGGRLCLDFTNTVSDRKAAVFRDYLAEYPDLLAWLDYTSAIPSGYLKQIAEQVESMQEGAVLQQARDLRELIYALFSAIAQQKAFPVAALSEFNERLRRTLPYRCLAKADEMPLSWDWNWNGSDSPERLFWPVIWSAAGVLTEDQPSRIKECPSCGWLFYDHSKNASRTWCSMQTCGSASKARRYYHRKKK